MPPVEATDDVTDVLAFLDAGEALGVVLPSHLKEKLDTLAGLRARKLRVALVGGFSEGKTALAAAWLGKVLGGMNISQRESSDVVSTYDAGDVELVDTPGLFGFKEATNGAGDIESYKDRTRKYVSEADLLLYVLDPKNPIKDSHCDELNWLFRDLHLLPRTVFVIGRFDTVADMEDADEYAYHLAIKTQNVRGRLAQLLHLSAAEEGSLSIVGVAAAPGGRRIDKWEEPEEFIRLSRIDELRGATSGKLQEFGGNDETKRATFATILSGVTQDVVMPARNAAEESERQAALADEKARDERPRLQRLRDDAAAAQIAIRKQVQSLFDDAVQQVRSASMEDFEACFDRVIGHDGIALESAVRNIFTQELGPVDARIDAMDVSFTTYVAGHAAGQAIADKMASHAASPISVSSDHVKAMRDRVKIPSKLAEHFNIKLTKKGTVSLQGKSAERLTKRINGGLAHLGLAIDIGTFLLDLASRERFAKSRDQMLAALEQQRKAVLAKVDASDFLPTYFPQLVEMEELFALLAAELREAVDRNRRMRAWASQADALNTRFRLSAPDLLIVEARD